MSDPFLGQIMLVGFNFQPQGWAFCDGRLLLINQNAALFTLLGATYGGDGRTNFALPDLRGRTAIGMGQGQGLSNYTIGQQAGAQSVTLSVTQMPAHNHGFTVDASTASTSSPAGGNIAQPTLADPGDDPAAAFATLREAVFDDVHLLHRLRGAADREAFVARVVAVGAASGLVFEADTMRAAMRAGEQRWLTIASDPR